MLLFAVLVSCGARSGLASEDREADPTDTPVSSVEPPGCAASAEVCNGLDDDCDGQADEGIVPDRCSVGAGLRFCVLGELSTCSCDCVPGARRSCFETYCTGWGVEQCTDDGVWSSCREVQPTADCDDGNSEPDPGDERCCIDAGGCCADEFDLDEDGDTLESLGECGGTLCG